MELPSKCVTDHPGPRATVKEEGISARVVSKDGNSFKIIRVDGCVIQDGERCDFIVEELSVGAALIELKGGNVVKACNQIFTTARTETIKNLLAGKKFCFIIRCTKFPRKDTRIQKQKDRAMKEFGCTIRSISSDKEIILSNLL